VGIRWFPSLERTVEVYGQVVKNGPYSKVAPEAQFRIGVAYEKQRDYLAAVHAYENCWSAIRNSRWLKRRNSKLAGVQEGIPRAEYDQNAANQAIAAFTDFLLRYPQSDKTPVAEQYLTAMKAEQARDYFISASSTRRTTSTSRRLFTTTT